MGGKFYLLRVFINIVTIVLIVTIYILLFVNVQLNLTGYAPAPISNTFQKIKAVYHGSSTTLLTDTPKSTRTLTDLFKGVQGNQTKDFDVNMSNPTAATLEILWYKPPEWINISSENNLLQSKCTYSNCRMSTNKTNLQKYAAVIFTLTEPLSHVPPIPRNERNPDQVWIFHFSESPVHLPKIQYRHENWRNTMNWSMSYNIDADIFRPYGVLHTNKVETERNYSAMFHRKTKLVAWAVSHCGAPSRRDEFVSELASYGVQIDIFGKCNNNAVLNSTELRQLFSKDYKFYLSFENSLCKDYVTEKFFSYYDLDIVLIVRGGLDYDRYLPNDTFINTAHFNSAKELAAYIHSVGSSEEAYVSYLRHKARYTANSIFSVPPIRCDICEKLNNLNENRKIIEDHVSYIHKDTCWNPKDIAQRSQTWLMFTLLAIFCSFLFLIIWKYNSMTIFLKRCTEK